MIKRVENDLFCETKGIIIDDSYDEAKLHMYINYFNSNNIEFIDSKDSDLSYLVNFKNVKYLALPCEISNLETLNLLDNIVGLRVFSNSISKISNNILNKIRYLDIIYNDLSQIDYSVFSNLTKLRISNAFSDTLLLNSKIEHLELKHCKKIKELKFINVIENLNSLKLVNNSKLENIDNIISLSDNLTNLHIIDCKKIKNLENICKNLINLKELEIITEFTDKSLTLNSLSFIKKLTKLEKFSTNYKIVDGDLSYLLCLKDANITEFYSHYNYKDNDLPHTHVVIYYMGKYEKVKLESLENGRNDSRIVWIK